MANIFDLTTLAYIGATAQINQDSGHPNSPSQTVTVHADDNTDITSFVGALGLTVGAVGIGAGLDLGLIDRNTAAYIDQNADVYAQGSIVVDANSLEDIVTLSTNAGVAAGLSIAGSASVYILNTVTSSYVGNSAVVASDSDLSVTANGIFEITSVAGALGASAAVGAGVANVTISHTDAVEAWVGDAANVTTHGSAGLTVAADSVEEIIGTSAAGAGAGEVAIAGSATVVLLDETTRAYIGRSAAIIADNGANTGESDVQVIADDATTIVSVAGSLAAAGSAALGIGADVAEIKKLTEAFIDSNVTTVVEGDIHVTADSVEDITSVAAGLSAGGFAGLAGDASVHVLDIATRSFIGDDPRDAVPSAGPGNVHAEGSIIVAADDDSEIDKVVGVLAVGGGAGLGAAAGVSTVDKNTEAFIGAGANVSADGNTKHIERANRWF